MSEDNRKINGLHDLEIIASKALLEYYVKMYMAGNTCFVRQIMKIYRNIVIA